MSGFLLGYKADVTAAFDPGFLYLADILAVEAQTHVFLDIMGGNMIAKHLFPEEFAVLDNEVGPAFDQSTKCVGVIGRQREQAMEKNQDKSAAKRGEKSRAAVDRAR